MTDTITAEELKKKIRRDEKVLIVDVLQPYSYEGHHVPSAINVPDGADFIDNLVQKTGAKKDSEIIVYCTSVGCTLSPRAAAMLQKQGYTNVKHFEEGLVGWQDAGFEFEGSATKS